MTIHTDTDRPPVYQHDGTWFYRASAIGSCINELVLYRKGEQGEMKSEYIERILDTGIEAEEGVRDRVAAKFEAGIASKSEAVQLEIEPGHIIVGNTDGRFFQGSALGAVTTGVEIKTLGEDAFKTFVKTGLDRFPEYQWQLSVYMHATGLPWVYAAALRNRYQDDDGEWQFEVDVSKTHILPLITTPPIPLSRIKRKVRRIATLAELPIEDLPQCEKAKFCSMIRFHDLIGGNADAEQGEIVEEGDELYNLIIRRLTAKKAEERAIARRKGIDEELKKLMEGPARIEGKGRMVPILMPGRTSYDSNQMILDGMDIEGYKRQGSPYSQLRWYEEKTDGDS